MSLRRCRYYGKELIIGMGCGFSSSLLAWAVGRLAFGIDHVIPRKVVVLISVYLKTVITKEQGEVESILWTLDWTSTLNINIGSDSFPLLVPSRELMKVP